MMKVNKEEIQSIVTLYEGEFTLYGIRFENKLRKGGEEVTDCSRNNIERDDEREFPEYGTDEYFELEEMDGISTWDINSESNDWLWNDDTQFIGKHAYLIGGNKLGHEQLNGIIDDGELLINDGVVLSKLY